MLMTEQNVVFLILVAILILVVGLVSFWWGRRQSRVVTPTDLPPNILALYQEIQALPARILATIQGSINPQKGKVAELLTYAELRYDYDNIIPLGSPVDFIGVKHGSRIDFIEVKSGGAVLSEEEKEVRRLIAGGKVNFRLINVKETAAEVVGRLD
jgi:hypothetical protein